MNCPRCKQEMTLNNDYDCEDFGCTCGDGIVTYYTCDCNCQVEVVLDCKGEKEEYE